ncbi:MAG: hypothetical protein H7258_09955 [Ferruginibacter sp.]|nr:hypothetical protein [Ferruginibacter sp.]
MRKLIQKITNWEAWPFKLIYAPLVPMWAWYMMKSQAVWFFTPSNPKITFGGMDGEPKKEMYELLPAGSYPTTFNVLPSEDLEEVMKEINAKEINFPLIVKPEMGGQGILFRKIDNRDQLQHYHNMVPVEYIVQRMVHYPIEVSVFYIRHPLDENGIVTGFLHKIPLQVVGDGKHSLEQLIQQHPKADKRVGELHNKHKANWQKIIPKDEKYVLSYAANHNRGAHFIDLKDQIDGKLVAVFDSISHGVNDFFYGRYDIMCQSIEGLKEGRDFTILEYNGCGAEPNHFYDTGYTLINAYKEILKHWKALYTISLYNKTQGVKPWPFMKGMKFRKETRELYSIMKKADIKIG